MQSIPLKFWKLSRKGVLRLFFSLPADADRATARIVIAQREDGKGEWDPTSRGSEFSYPLADRVAQTKLCRAKIYLNEHPWHDARWDVLVSYISQQDGTQQVCELSCTPKQRLRFYLTATQSYLPHHGIAIPYLNSRRCFSLIFRDRHPYDAPLYHTKELLACFIYLLFPHLWPHKRIWLVFEKNCARAQDNGFYFFKWCMETLPTNERKHIYYVIEKDSPDYANVAPYRKNVIHFMSFKHFLYSLASEMLVASETKIHLSPYRSRPSYVKHILAKTMTFFLQHGVMAFKRTDKRMGATGWHPVDYFLVSSPREQDVITGSFGYDAAHVPVLGQARWDALEDHSDPLAPRLLLMPTWREWLASDSPEEFMQTDFYRAYEALLSNPELNRVLEEHSATLQVFFHPLFLSLAPLFHTASKRIHIIQPGQMPLNQIIMGCSAMITDYSSAVWDAIYQGKPALFYHFDRATYMEKTGSYINFDTELPGERYLTAEDLIKGIATTIENSFTPSVQQEKAAELWFAHRDKNNCQRIYDCALQIEQQVRPKHPFRKRSSPKKLSSSQQR